jgi:hypothetical protein
MDNGPYEELRRDISNLPLIAMLIAGVIEPVELQLFATNGVLRCGKSSCPLREAQPHKC